MIPGQTQPQAQPQGPPAPQGPPGQEEGGFAQKLDAGGTTMSDQEIIIVAADIAEKQIMGQQLEPAEEFFVQRFFPNGIPPELAEMSTEKLEAAAAQSGNVFEPPPQTGAPGAPQAPPQAPGGQY